MFYAIVTGLYVIKSLINFFLVFNLLNMKFVFFFCFLACLKFLFELSQPFSKISKS